MPNTNQLDDFNTVVESLFLEPVENSQPLASDATPIQQLISDAIESPVNYPRLADSVFPGDQITILLQADLPNPARILDALVDAMSAAGIETADLQVVLSENASACFELSPIDTNSPDSEFPVWHRCSQRSEMRFLVHDPEDEQGVAYLAANKEGLPVYVNRILHESDFVIPVCCPGPKGVAGDCLYPFFSNQDTRSRYRKKKETEKQLNQESALANDSLGIFFTIAMISGPGATIEEVICGERNRTWETSINRTNDLWKFESPDDCEMVVTTIESSPAATTWKQVVTAVVNAATITTGDGPIVVLSELQEKPKAKVRAACQSQFEGTISSALPKKLQFFAAILAERQVFLKSRHSRDTIEDLGLGHIESAEEVTRIASGFRSPALLRDGHLRVISDS